MSPIAVRVRPSADRAGPRDAGGLVVVRGVLMMIVVLDLATTWLAEWLGHDTATPTGVAATALAVVAASRPPRPSSSR